MQVVSGKDRCCFPLLLKLVLHRSYHLYLLYAGFNKQFGYFPFNLLLFYIRRKRNFISAFICLKTINPRA